MNRTPEKVVKAFFATWLMGLLFYLAVLTAIVVIVLHFVVKYW